MTTTTPGATTKTCPRCAEEIKVEAKVCRYCHAQFVVEHHGYCSHCHAVVTLADGKDDCPVCNGPLVDILTDSRLVEATPLGTTSTPAAAGEPPTPPAPTSQPAGVLGQPAAAQAPQAGAAPIGKLRRAVVPTMLQWVANQITALAIAALMFMPVASAAFDGLRLNAEEAGSYIQQAHALGPAFALIAIVMALLMPWRAAPRTIGGSRMRARASFVPFLRQVRTEFHTRALYRAGGFLPRVVGVVSLWVGSIVLFMASSSTPEGWETLAGTTITWTILAVGITASLLMLPLGRLRHVRIDDEGNFFPDDEPAG